jgi:GNAT superfamily N-acetyltransferase
MPQPLDGATVIGIMASVSAKRRRELDGTVISMGTAAFQQQDITLRAAVAGDAPAIARIWHAGWPDGHLGNVPDALLAVRDESSFGRRAAERISDTTVAVVSGEVVGFTMVVADELEQIYVAASHRGLGVADALMTDAEHRIRAAGHGRAWLAVVPGNARARRFYERRGWTDDGPFEYPAEAGSEPVPVPAQRYVRTL